MWAVKGIKGSTFTGLIITCTCIYMYIDTCRDSGTIYGMKQDDGTKVFEEYTLCISTCSVYVHIIMVGIENTKVYHQRSVHIPREAITLTSCTLWLSGSE